MFDIEKYDTPSPSFLKGLDGDFAPNRVVWEKQHPQDKYYFHEGNVMEEAVLQPEIFEKKYVVDGSGINTETKGYRFTKAYEAGTKIKGWDQEKAVEVAVRYSNLSTPKTLKGLLNKLAEKGEKGFARFVDHYAEFGGQNTITQELYDLARGHRDRAWGEHSQLRDYMEDSRWEIQKEVKWTNSNTGVNCRGFIDGCIQDEVIVDLKAMAVVRPDKYAYYWGQMRKLGQIEQVCAYQDGLYQSGGKQVAKLFIYAMEKHPTTNPIMFEVSGQDNYHGHENFSKWCGTFKFLKENKLWHLGYEFGIHYAYDESNYTYKPADKLAVFETAIYS